jgi:hypothetical protein
MNGDYTKVPLRPEDRWTGARMQEGRVLLDHEWNLNLDASERNARAAVTDAVGAAGVVEGSDAFEVGVSAEGDLDLTVGAGRIWVGGMMALAPSDFAYSSQDAIEPLPAGGRALVYLDVFEEHVQPAEDQAELVDPALAPVDSAARTRTGYRVRAQTTKAETCRDAVAELSVPALSSGKLTIERADLPAPPDPCDPPGDPRGRIPDGLLRVEVLDGGDGGSARFAWSFENGGATVAAKGLEGEKVALAPSQAVRFANGDLVEVSWLARRADRADHGALFKVDAVLPGAGGDILTLDRAPAPPEGAFGLVVRRWDGEAEGAEEARQATLRDSDLGVRFAAGEGEFLPGDWWGARLREGTEGGIEKRVDAAADGTPHAVAPLALVDLDARQRLSDCRPTFKPLTQLDTGACTVVARPGDDLQEAIAALPEEGGKLCLAAGTFELGRTVVVRGGRRIAIAGTGPATIVRVGGAEAAFGFEECTEVELRQLRIEGGSRGAPPGDRRLNGAVTFVGCDEVVVADCVLTCPRSEALAQTCITARAGDEAAGRVRIERNRFEVGGGQTGVLVVDADDAFVAANRIGVPGAMKEPGGQGIVVAGRGGGAARISDNLVEGVMQGIHVGASDAATAGRDSMDSVGIRANIINLVVPAEHKRERHGIFVGNARAIQVLDTIATLRRSKQEVAEGNFTEVEGIRLHGIFGPFISVHRSSLDGFDVGVRVEPLEIPQGPRMWMVAETMAGLAGVGVDAPQVEEQMNFP